MTDLAILSPSTKPIINEAVSEGARHGLDDLSSVRRLVLAMKPARWRDISADLVRSLAPNAVVLSVMAGVPATALSGVFGPRPITRVMPTTAVSAAKGVATCWSGDPIARETALALFGPISRLVEVEGESLIDVATAVSGSGAAYVYAFVRAMARAGEAVGLESEQAHVLALATASGAITRLEEGGGADALIAEVASPGGTTQAGLVVLEPDLSRLVEATVQAALAKTRELSAQ